MCCHQGDGGRELNLFGAGLYYRDGDWEWVLTRKMEGETSRAFFLNLNIFSNPSPFSIPTAATTIFSHLTFATSSEWPDLAPVL